MFRDGFVITTTIVVMVQMRENSVTLSTSPAVLKNSVARISNVFVKCITAMEKTIVGIIQMKWDAVSAKPLIFMLLLYLYPNVS